MSERQVAIGDTSSYRYIGIEPPLEDEEVSSLIESIILPDYVVFRTISYSQELHEDAPPHTELCFETGTPEDYLGREVVDQGAFSVAKQIARLLEQRGDGITLIEHIVPTDFQTPLFGNRYYEMVATAERFKARREQNSS